MNTVNKFKLSAAAVALLFSVYRAISGNIGDSIFGVVIAILLFLGETSLTPKELVERCRSYFYDCDIYARNMMITLGVGGTALCIDVVYGIDFLNDSLDVWIKRISPALVLIGVALYFASIISKRIYEVSYFVRDESIRKYEIYYYGLVMLSILSVFLFFIGLPVEQYIPSSREHPIYFIWDKDYVKAFGVLISIITVWKVSMMLCIFSRFLEWFWKDNVASDSKTEI